MQNIIFKTTIFKTIIKKLIADSITPVSLYLKLRNTYSNILLLEYFNNNNKTENTSIICINPISEIVIDNNIIKIIESNNSIDIPISKNIKIQKIIDDFLNSFQSEDVLNNYSGLYGYISYDSIKYFDNLKLKPFIIKSYKVPELRLGFYSNLIIFHHLYNEISVIEHNNYKINSIPIKKILNIINNNNILNTFKFKKIGNISSNITDEEHEKMILKGINFCLKGDVFQIVISRQFKQKFIGDEFNVYRSLRNINPSPYLFYFDYGDYKIFGSSPESQVIINNKIVYINPIAGTVKRSNDLEKNKKLKNYLIKNIKENSEHVMLVDLARNDLSKNSSNVKVEYFKKIKNFSHVMHMVSRVSGSLKDKVYSIIKIFIDTFPAGTLSGAPKYKAMQLIDQIENQHRGCYGGAIGFFGFNGNMNTAIVIRSFISKNNNLFFQAGGGIVYKSNIKDEVQEVKNKLMVLFKSIEIAQKL